MQGEICEVDGVLRITDIRVQFDVPVPDEAAREKAGRLLPVFADRCPAYVSVRDCIRVQWDANIRVPS